VSSYADVPLAVRSAGMTVESARAAIEEALTQALKGETAEVSPAEHGVSAAELSDIADKAMAERDLDGKLDIRYVTESREDDGTLMFHPAYGR
jgi:hypothetical protein